MKKKKNDPEEDNSSDDQLSPIQCVEIYLIGSELKILKRGKKKIDERTGFQAHGAVTGRGAVSFLGMKVNKPLPDDKDHFVQLTFTMRGMFAANYDIPGEDFRTFIQRFSLSTLLPYAREYATDQLRRAGTSEWYLPFIEIRAFSDQMVEEGRFEVEILNDEEENIVVET